MSTRQSLWIALDDDLVRALDQLATAKRITGHELARIALRLGVEAMRQRQGAAR